MLTELIRDRIAKLQQCAEGARNGRPRDRRRHWPRTRELPDGREAGNDLGRHWLIEHRLTELWPKGKHAIENWHRQRSAAPETFPAQKSTQERVSFRRHFPQATVLLDLETCGLAGSMVFLVGLVHQGESGLTLTQLFARDYSEEPAVLASLWQIMTTQRVLVTFNGKSFDWPMICDRTTLHRMDQQTSTSRARRTKTSNLVHFDLLHHARRRYSAELPDCRLTTLERHVCGRRRVGDIPGGDIPTAYHDYVRTGETHELAAILHHHDMDLVPLLELALHITAA
jgi:uncharacterized protein YprB with RNaseH-like and TPR domain